MRLTYKLEEPIITKYLHYDYMIIADYDISKGNYGRITDSEIYNKLGQYEDIDESPEHLAKINKAFEIIKKHIWYYEKQNRFIFVNMDEDGIMDLLKEVLIND